LNKYEYYITLKDINELHRRLCFDIRNQDILPRKPFAESIPGIWQMLFLTTNECGPPTLKPFLKLMLYRRANSTQKKLILHTKNVERSHFRKLPLPGTDVMILKTFSPKMAVFGS
jgi:hypothetical protein